jgi:hypothetical protein
MPAVARGFETANSTDQERALEHRHRFEVGAEQQQPDVDQDDRHPIGRKQRGEHRASHDALDQHALEIVTRDEEHRHDQ